MHTRILTIGFILPIYFFPSKRNSKVLILLKFNFQSSSSSWKFVSYVTYDSFLFAWKQNRHFSDYKLTRSYEIICIIQLSSYDCRWPISTVHMLLRESKCNFACALIHSSFQVQDRNAHPYNKNVQMINPKVCDVRDIWRVENQINNWMFL